MSPNDQFEEVGGWVFLKDAGRKVKVSAVADENVVIWWYHDDTDTWEEELYRKDEVEPCSPPSAEPETREKELEERIKQLHEQGSPIQVDRIATLESRLEVKDNKIGALEEEIRKLRNQLGRDSRSRTLICPEGLVEYMYRLESELNARLMFMTAGEVKKWIKQLEQLPKLRLIPEAKSVRRTDDDDMSPGQKTIEYDVFVSEGEKVYILDAMESEGKADA